TLKPGARLVQSTLAEQLGVSRTPIREALHELDSERLVTISAYKGAAPRSSSRPTAPVSPSLPPEAAWKL
ncbi:MAG TPA: GntR family transcriptional regulator, partial [Candidatus Sulfomarinibacteraceae bacterium]|nr:GntR family transcriptional regulator [Candidatus Sulfomarinibacteraceae bacterium]